MAVFRSITDLTMEEPMSRGEEAERLTKLAGDAESRLADAVTTIQNEGLNSTNATEYREAIGTYMARVSGRSETSARSAPGESGVQQKRYFD